MPPRSNPLDVAIRLIAALALALAATGAGAAERVALLIGNNAYATTPLRNAVNDAKDLGDALKELGFHVIVRENTARREMIEAIREFDKALEGANTALFFYAGHAMQFKDRNYLIPIDAAMGSEEDVTFFSVEVAQIFDRMAARAHASTSSSSTPAATTPSRPASDLERGLAPDELPLRHAHRLMPPRRSRWRPRDSVRNGIYTKHIPAEHPRSRRSCGDHVQRVREGVERKTRKQQTPWARPRSRRFAFSATGRAAAAAAPASGRARTPRWDRARVLGELLRDSNRPRRYSRVPRQIPQRQLRGARAQPPRGARRPARPGAPEPEARRRRACNLQRPQRTGRAGTEALGQAR